MQQNLQQGKKINSEASETKFDEFFQVLQHPDFLDGLPGCFSSILFDLIFTINFVDVFRDPYQRADDFVQMLTFSYRDFTFFKFSFTVNINKFN